MEASDRLQNEHIFWAFEVLSLKSQTQTKHLIWVHWNLRAGCQISICDDLWSEDGPCDSESHPLIFFSFCFLQTTAGCIDILIFRNVFLLNGAPLLAEARSSWSQAAQRGRGPLAPSISCQTCSDKTKTNLEKISGLDWGEIWVGCFLENLTSLKLRWCLHSEFTLNFRNTQGLFKSFFLQVSAESHSWLLS